MTTEIPFEIEELGRTMGISPERAAKEILNWFVEPMLSNGLLVHRRFQPAPAPKRRGKVKRAIDDYVARQGLDRGIAVERMVERSVR